MAFSQVVKNTIKNGQKILFHEGWKNLYNVWFLKKKNK